MQIGNQQSSDTSIASSTSSKRVAFDGLQDHQNASKRKHYAKDNSILVVDPYHGYKSDSQLYFTEELNCSRKWSLYMTVIFVIITWNTFIKGIEFTFLTNVQNTTVRCKVPELERTNWTSEEIAQISQFSNDTSMCYYYDHDYVQLARLTFDDAFNITESFAKVKVKSCRVFIVTLNDVKYQRFDKDFSKCVPPFLRHRYFIISAELLGFLVVGVIADMYGRRTALLTALPIAGFFSVLSAFRISYIGLIIFNLIREAALTGAAFVSTVYFLEMIHYTLRIYFIGLIWIGYAVGGFTKIFLNREINFEGLTTELHMWIINCTYLVPICIEWFIPESPHWLLCYKRWDKMHEVLSNLNYPYILPLNERYKDAEPSPKISVKAIVKTIFKPAFFKKLILGAFLYGMIFFLYFSETTRLVEQFAFGITYSALQGLVMLANLLLVPLLLKVFTRPMSICWCLLTLAMFCTAATVYNLESDAGNILGYISLTAVQAASLIIGLLLVETFPTKIRTTAVCLCRALGLSLQIISSVIEDYTNIGTWIGIYAWTIKAGIILVAAFMCVLVSNTGDIPLPDTELQAIIHF